MSRHQTEDQASGVQAILERAYRFRTLAAVFAYPDPGQGEAIRKAMAPLLEAGPAGAGNGGREALDAFAVAWDGIDEDALRAEYGRLFLGQTPCPLHAAAYSGGRTLAGPSAELADISGFYQAFGVDVREDAPERPDHLTVELEFYATLLVKEAYARFNDWQEPAEVTGDAARDFLAEHLGRWRGVLTGRLGRFDAGAPFPELAAWLDEVLDLECRLRRVAPEPFGDPVADPMQGDALACPHAGDSGVPREQHPLNFTRL
jgi:TorA maturation chaperone TorD